MKKKLPKISTIRTKADNLLSPLIKKLYPKCLLCPFAGRNNKTQVAHHFIHKSKSTRLRYELENLIPLCHACHQMLHNNESYWSGVIILEKGVKWFEDLERKKNEIVKADVHYFINNYERLKTLQVAPVTEILVKERGVGYNVNK